MNDFQTVEECDGFYRTAISIIILIAVVWMMVNSCVDGICKTVEIEEAKKKKAEPVYIVEYSRPKAFRLSTPTQEQMDHLHALLIVDQVRKANGEVPDGSEM